MNLKELQNWVKEDWEKASKNTPDSHLQLLYLIEELGEVAEAIRKTEGNKDYKEMQIDLTGEMGDVLIALATLANHYGIDLAIAAEKSKQKIIDRHTKGL